MKKELEIMFKYTAPNEMHRAKFEQINAKMLEFVELIDEVCPDSREKSLAFTKLDECRFYANGSIVRRCEY